MSPSDEPIDRRARVREATLAEIRAIARRLLETQGPAAVSINAIAREMGVSGPALYRYHASHAELVGALTAGLYEELSAAIRAARDARPRASTAQRLLAMCRAMRQWALANRAAFGWLFTSRATGGDGTPQHAAAHAFGQLFHEVVTEAWEAQPFEVPPLRSLAPALQQQLKAYAAEPGNRLPPAALHVFLSTWIRLYGLLCMEVLDQLSFAYTDMDPVFEQCLKEQCGQLGLAYSAPPRA